MLQLSLYTAITEPMHHEAMRHDCRESPTLQRTDTAKQINTYFFEKKKKKTAQSSWIFGESSLHGDPNHGWWLYYNQVAHYSKLLAACSKYNVAGRMFGTLLNSKNNHTSFKAKPI